MSAVLAGSSTCEYLSSFFFMVSCIWSPTSRRMS